MKNKNIVLNIAAVVGLGLYSCRPTTSVPTPVKGSADFSKYVAIGNSITSGFADAALYYDGQMVSYPNLLAQKFAEVGGGTFIQPLVPQNSVGVGSTGNSKLVLGIVNGSLSPVPADTKGGDLTIWTNSVATSGPFNNMGVPGAKAITTVYPGYGNPANGAGKYNPFFTRMTTAPATASILGDAAAQKPTFFSMFIGSNDVLAYALTGGTSDAISPSSGSAGIGFDASIDAIVNTMTANGAKGVIANIPDITSIPYFTTVPYNPVPLDTATATSLNTQVFGPIIQILTAAGQGSRLQLLKTTNNPLLIKDESLTNLSTAITTALVGAGVNAQQAGLLGIIFGQARHATSADLIPLPTSSIIGTAPSSPYAVSPFNKYGVTYPLEDSYVLRGKFGSQTSEVDSITTATAAYNAKLKAVAASKGLAFVDVNAFLAQVKTGIHYNGRDISATFVTGGAFSLDGIHLTPLGNAMLANKFIDAINSTYSSTLKEIDASTYIGVKFP